MDREEEPCFPLHWAAEEGDANTVEKMLWNGFYIDHETNDDWTPLHLATRKGHFLVVKLLLRHGADIHAKINNTLRSTAVHIAAMNDHEMRFEVAFCLGQSKDFGEISLHAASEEGADC